MTINVAIIGSGPAGFYAAEALAKRRDDIRIDIIERLPSPYGLIRGGVAPDHQTTKRVAKKFEQTALRPQVEYFGNIESGRDISLEELRDIYDAVVLAVGAPNDNNPHIPGIDKIGVYGSAEFVGWYNAHPDFCNLNPDLNTETAIIIGLGNVALDAARVLVRTEQGMAGADLPDYATQAIKASPIKDVYITGRRGIEAAKFSLVELREMGELNHTVPLVKQSQLEADLSILDEADARKIGRLLSVLEKYTKNKAEDKAKRVHFEFNASPSEILGGTHIEGIRFERTSLQDGKVRGTGEFFDIPCGLAVFATGYKARPIEGAPFDHEHGVIPNTNGRVKEGLYVAGWIKRGPAGVISSNRPDGEVVAQDICANYADSNKPGRDGLLGLIAQRGLRRVTFDDWKKIEAAEIEAAHGDHPRSKFFSIDDMLAVLDPS